MDKIQPLSYITDTDPVAQAIQNVSGWYTTEYMTIEWDGLNPTNYLEWYMAQGWVMYNKTSTWRMVGGLSIQYSTGYLKRRKLQSEKVLQSLVSDFTNAYNEGRSINDQRYDEIVRIWSVALDKTEDEINALGADDYDTIIDSIINQLPNDLDDFENNISGILDDYGDSRRTAINVRFDSELSKAQQDLINRGLYNTTTWASVSAGIEREREQALTDFEDTLVERKVDIELALLKARIQIRQAMIDAHNRWMDFRRTNRFAPLEIRNSILKAMLDFMERRTDSYPGIDALAGMTAQLGYSEGAATVAP
jgi:hypothetical protein